MKMMKEKILDLLTSKKRKVPILYINFDYSKYVRDGAKGSCVCNVHPELANDSKLVSMLNEVVDYIRDTYDMEELIKI